eukprot:1423038-Alexandrium_andersonii.AAC.1
MSIEPKRSTEPTRTFRPAGLLGAAASSTWKLGPFSRLANGPFRAVDVLNLRMGPLVRSRL